MKCVICDKECDIYTAVGENGEIISGYGNALIKGVINFLCSNHYSKWTILVGTIFKICQQKKDIVYENFSIKHPRKMV